MTHSDSVSPHGFAIGFSGLLQQVRISPSFFYVYPYQLHPPPVSYRLSFRALQTLCGFGHCILLNSCANSVFATFIRVVSQLSITLHVLKFSFFCTLSFAHHYLQFYETFL